MTYREFIPDLITIIEFYLKTSMGPETSIDIDSLYGYLLKKINMTEYNINDQIDCVKLFSYSDLLPYEKTFTISNFICFHNTHKYDINDVKESIGEFLIWKNTWLQQYIEQYPDDKYYTNIYNDTYKPIISIVIVPFERYICFTPYELWFYIN